MINGITYYKLSEDRHLSKEDVTKYDSLTGSEIDNNFYLLEGRDIIDIKVSEDKKKLQIVLLNGETIESPNIFDDLTEVLKFEYNDKTGVLSIYVNEDDEEPIEVEGFLTLGDIAEYLEKHHVVTDNSLTGNGSSYSPLSISRSHRTGAVRPIDWVVDIQGGESLPTTNPYKPDEPLPIGFRCISYEEVNPVGKFYNFWGLKDIINALNEEDNGWHVPTKPEWDALLDAMEPADYRNHCRLDDSVALGKMANKVLCNDGTFGLEYCGYANKEENMHLSYIGTQVYFWTASTIMNKPILPDEPDNKDKSRNAYSKGFLAGGDGVYQNISDNTRFYSIRLVKKCGEDENISAAEILGSTYPVSVMRSAFGENRMWTTVNFNYDTGNDNTFTPSESEIQKGPESKLYVNEWDGMRWLKSTIDENIMFFLRPEDTIYYIKDNALEPVPCKSDLSNIKLSEDLPVYGIGQIGTIKDGDTISAGTSMLDILKLMLQNEVGTKVEPEDATELVTVTGVEDFCEVGTEILISNLNARVTDGTYTSADPKLYTLSGGKKIDTGEDVQAINGVLGTESSISNVEFFDENHNPIDKFTVEENKSLIVECNLSSNVKPYKNNGELDEETWGLVNKPITKNINIKGSYKYFCGYCPVDNNGWDYLCRQWDSYDFDRAVGNSEFYEGWCNSNGVTLVGENLTQRSASWETEPGEMRGITGKPCFVVVLPAIIDTDTDTIVKEYEICSMREDNNDIDSVDLEYMWGGNIYDWPITNHKRFRQFTTKYHDDGSIRYYVYVFNPQGNSTFTNIGFEKVNKNNING